MKLLLTRPQLDSEAFAEKLAAYGIESIIAPMLTIEPIAHRLLPDYPNGIILTSKHALTTIIDYAHYKAIPLYLVGESTCEHARAMGFLDIRAAAPTATELAKKLPPERLLYLSGEDITHEFLNVDRVVVYRARAVQSMPSLVGIDGVVFFSTRTAQIFQALAGKLRLDHIIAYVLSDAVAAVCKGWKTCKVAENPSGTSLLSIIVSFK